jgi:hypothetical protein
LATVSESVILVEDLGIMLETRRSCGMRLRAFLETDRLHGIFINEVPGDVWGAGLCEVSWSWPALQV